MTDIHFNSGTVRFDHSVETKIVFNRQVEREKTMHPRAPWRSHALKKRAFIVKFASAQDLYEDVYQMNA